MQANEQDPQTMMILGVLAGYNLFGSGGLKDRTGLIEYQYDNV